MIYGYARVSTTEQKREGNSLTGQRDEILTAYPGAQITEEAYSGAKERPKFNALLGTLQEGDTLVVTKMDRFCRTTKEGLTHIDLLQERGVSIHILNLGLIEDSPIGRMIMTCLLAFAEFERNMIRERTQAGLAIARQNPDFKEGRPKMDVPQFAEYYERTKQGDIGVRAAARELGISMRTWYRLAEVA